VRHEVAVYSHVLFLRTKSFVVMALTRKYKTLPTGVPSSVPIGPATGPDLGASRQAIDWPTLVGPISYFIMCSIVTLKAPITPDEDHEDRTAS